MNLSEYASIVAHDVTSFPHRIARVSLPLYRVGVVGKEYNNSHIHTCLVFTHPHLSPPHLVMPEEVLSYCVGVVR